MKSQTSKIVLTIIITSLVVGGSIYFWQQKYFATIGDQNQQKGKPTTSELQEGISEYRSSSGIKFKFPLHLAIDFSSGLVCLSEDQTGNIMLCSKNQPTKCQGIKLHRKSPTTDIKDAFKALYKISEEHEKQGYKIIVQELEPSPTGLLRFQLKAKSPPDAPSGILAPYISIVHYGARVIAFYNPKRPDRFVTTVIVHDTILSIDIIEDSLEIEEE